MLNKETVLGSLATLGIILGTSGIASAEMPHQMSPNTSVAQPIQFHRIKQPLGLKVGVAVGGLALISLEMWWFLFSNNTKPNKN